MKEQNNIKKIISYLNSHEDEMSLHTVNLVISRIEPLLKAGLVPDSVVVDFQQKRDALKEKIGSFQ
ncbi:hypothetical protein RYA05_00910 [Pseudomonas syringae pv. actinidiae]|nr:hypothetical protein [Pseudomonas syringae pv. actinidiae]